MKKVGSLLSLASLHSPRIPGLGLGPCQNDKDPSPFYRSDFIVLDSLLLSFDIQSLKVTYI